MLDIQQLSEEYVKCYSDKSRIYMITHYLKTYDGTQGKEVPFNLFPRQQILCQTLGCMDGSVATTKYRQAGISTVGAGFIACESCLADEGSPKNTLIIGNTLKIAQQMFTKIYEFLMQFPLWMWGNTQEFIDKGYDITQPPKNDGVIFIKRNQEEMILKNGCKIYARSSDVNAGRGLSITYLVFDEVAFIENASDVYTASLPTISSIKGAKTLFISTPNGKDALYYPTVQNARLKGTKDWNGFNLVEMFWYQDPRYNRHLEWTRKNETTGEWDIIKEETIDELGNIRYDEEKWEKMIKEGWKPRSPWYFKMCQQFNNDPQKIAQELDASFLGSDSTVLAPEFIQMQRDLNNREPDPNYGDPLLEDLWVWKPPMEGHHYLLAIDNSCGSSDDATAFEIIDQDGIDEDGLPCLEQVLEYNGKLTGDAVGELAYKYGALYNNAFIVVECIGGYGDATILTLMAMKYPNLYYDDPSLKKYVDQNDASTLKVTKDGLPGFRSSSLRIQILSNFANMVKTNQFKIRSKRVCNELDTWVFKNGRPDHKEGAHDDTITCLAMGLFVLEYSIKKQIQNRSLDGSMLRAMISVNAPTKNSEQMRRSYQANNGVFPIYSAKQEAMNSEAAKYKANMWLLI